MKYIIHNVPIYEEAVNKLDLMNYMPINGHKILKYRYSILTKIFPVQVDIQIFINRHFELLCQ